MPPPIPAGFDARRFAILRRCVGVMRYRLRGVRQLAGRAALVRALITRRNQVRGPWREGCATSTCPAFQRRA